MWRKRIVCGSHFSPPVIWFVGIELRSLGLVASPILA